MSLRSSVEVKDQPNGRSFRETSKLIRRTIWDHIKGVQTLHTPWSFSATLPLKHCYKTPHQIPPGWDSQFLCHICLARVSLVAQRLKHLLAMQETWVRSLCQEDPLEKEMATYSSTLAWRIPWTEDPGGLQSTGSQRVGHNWATSLHFHFL